MLENIKGETQGTKNILNFVCLFQMRTYKYRNVARFGLMHMVATNLCVWLLTVILESRFEIQRLGSPSILADIEPSHGLIDHHLDQNITYEGEGTVSNTQF